MNYHLWDQNNQPEILGKHRYFAKITTLHKTAMAHSEEDDINKKVLVRLG
jgi:hypothetical protein